MGHIKMDCAAIGSVEAGLAKTSLVNPGFSKLDRTQKSRNSQGRIKAICTGIGRKSGQAKKGQARKRQAQKGKVRPVEIDTAQHIAILEMGVSIWNQWRASEPLTVPNLQNANLSGRSLENANLARANLRGACLEGAYLYDADFQEADLRGALLDRSVLIGANFCKANLAGATLNHAYLAQSDLSFATFVGASLESADLQSAILTQSTFTQARLAAAEMTQCFGLTPSQIQSAADGYMAFLPDNLKALVSSTPDSAVDAGIDADLALPTTKVFRP